MDLRERSTITGPVLARAWALSGRSAPLLEPDEWDGFALTVRAVIETDASRSCTSGEYIPDADAALRSITTRGQRPAGRGEWIAHEVDEVHSPGEPCRFCAALSRPATPPLDVERLARALDVVIGNGSDGDFETAPHGTNEWRSYADDIAREYAATPEPEG